MMKALVVETDPTSRGVFLGAFESTGYEALSCPTTSEARELFDSYAPEMVVVNGDEPSEASADFCRWVRSRPDGDAIWILSLSASDEPFAAVTAMDGGASDFLVKPVGEITARLRVITAAKQLQQLHQRREAESTGGADGNLRAQQQAAISALGQCALMGVDLGTVMTQASIFVAQILEVEYSAVLELSPDRQELLLIEGMGWPSGFLRSARVSADAQSTEGSTLHIEPTVVSDWQTEPRFRWPVWANALGLRSGLFVTVPGVSASPFGVLGVYSTQKRTFAEDDIHFLKAAAIVLSLAVERQRSEAAIQRLAAFARCNPNPILEFRPDGELTYSNEAAEEVARSIGRGSVLGLLPEDFRATVQHCVASGESRLHQPVVLGRRTLAWSFFPIRENQVVHCYAEEMTGRLELENQLRQLQKMECVGQLAAGLAHDFNNLLTIIRGHAELTLLDKALAEKKVASLNKVVSAVERGSHLTRQLLTFSRRQVLQPAPLDLNECLRNVMKMLDRVLGENIEFKLEPAVNLPPVLGDAGMLDQVVMNLAVNARDAMPKGGRLIVTTSRVEVDEDHLRRRSEARLGQFACLGVTDTGSGMDEKVLAHIFEPFFTTKRPGKGTGLGLATVYGIIKQHNGWIEVTSEVGQGTTFLIFLPCSDTAAAATPAAGRTDHVAGGSETILVVEDEPTLRELARMILQNYGYKVLEAGSGTQALNVWQKDKHRIDLLLTDVIMPEGVSGTELGQRLLSEKPMLKIIYASGYGSEILGKDQAGETHFLAKPFTTLKLARAVRDCLDEGRA